MKLGGKPKTMLPKGVATFLPEGAAKRRAIERKLLDAFAQWGYQEVIPPIFEYLDVFSLGVGEELLNRAYKFVDRSTGRMMVLRPDVTPQIARMAATVLKNEPWPLRLCYSANVFRHEEEHAGREREILQVGGELIGPSDAEADAEIITLAIEVLKRLGLGSFKIALGQMDFTRAILQPAEYDPALLRKTLLAVAKKEATQLELLLEGSTISAKGRRRILGLLDLFGGEEIFKRALSLADSAACRKALERLEAVYSILKRAGFQENLLIDLGEARGFDYYTGVIFEIFSEGVGAELGGGGRYDHLLEKYGASAAGAGFALHVERIERALEKNAPEAEYSSADVWVLHTEKAAAHAMSFSQKLRRSGYRVIRQNGFSGKMESYLKSARQQHIGKIFVLTKAALEEPIESIDVESGKVQSQSQDRVLNKQT